MLRNKNILIMGVRNKWSIAWGITMSCLEQDANVILTYRGEREKEAIEKLIEGDYASKIRIYPCDVSSDDEIKALFDQVAKDYGILHGLVHSVAFANTEDLRGAFIDTSREGFLLAMNISAYSLVAVSRFARELMKEGGSIVTLTYNGANRVVPGYNVMGVAKAALESCVRYLAADLGPQNIRVNAISAGPVKTVSAMGIQNFGSVLEVVEQRAPLKRNVTQKEIGDTAVCLLSEYTAGTTGQIIYVDSGFSIMGM
ncbi:enoyl-[acyl-carrier-protein] reductase [NADH] FabI [Thermoclostridium stercorarium subsp. stercorarium DSM 8532]|uniref:Enoyl-[acyl-carrier-protein] reductase [NADH] n=2 Tax=Thermoclostridium stercorarium TaxID=1510 RepID=L7VQT2_THES1|nr:enoyl-ACP reductase [Thermoclostridium stercorarium]AGC67933.1 enoyl-[acyl-carrier-protein] reductase [NADH] FabI [Thermoclostridium stercorarium subsp. stercorarium DSM 8532]AGI38969.1 enoyl-acyl-carrier-protein NADH reductase [Thermoclostridium stercorarium subsp. stercorarium DSM 8532]ANW98337.1 enoyl-ACP reductase [Thermoclostridium stercorarium subsp. thermolacticum DSM 2910]UZQ86479.1 enoyl-ACP reductase [Thermoclostridium stercorarium]